MAVLKVSQISPGRGGAGHADRNREYHVPFQVIVDNAYSGPLAAANAVDPNNPNIAIPPRYTEYVGFEDTSDNDDPNALCTEAIPRIASTGTDWVRWIVDCTFRTNYQFVPQNNPTDDPILPWVEIETYRKKVWKLYDGTAILNAAGQLVDSITDDVDSITLCFLRNESTINPLYGMYNGAVNNDAFYFMQAYQGKMKIVLDRPQRRNGQVYWPHTYKVKFNYGDQGKGWAIDPANQGTLVKLSDGTQAQPINPNTGLPISGTVNLDAQGRLLAPGGAVTLYSLSQLIDGYGNPLYPNPMLINTPRTFGTLGLGGAWTSFS